MSKGIWRAGDPPGRVGTKIRFNGMELNAGWEPWPVSKWMLYSEDGRPIQYLSLAKVEWLDVSDHD